MAIPKITIAAPSRKRLRATNLPALAAARSPIPAELGRAARRFRAWPIGRGRGLSALAELLAELSARLPLAAAPAPIGPKLPQWAAAECQRLAIPAELVAAAYDHFAAANESIIRRREMRQSAWRAHNANNPRSWPSWRNGFRGRYGKRVDAHDYTAIPRYDQLHGEISAYFPEFSGREFEFYCELLGPLPRLISTRELWQSAIAAVAEHAASSAAAAS